MSKKLFYYNFKNLSIRHFIRNWKLEIRNSNQAFGLIEVIVSTSIILIVAGAALGLGRLALKNSVISYERTQAYNLAREAMETIRNQRDYHWNERSTTFGTDLIDDIRSLNLDGEIKLGSSTFTRSVTPPTLLTPNDVTKINDIIKKSDPDNPDLILISNEFGVNVNIIVSWKSYGKEHSTTLNSVLTDWKPADVGWE